MTQIGTQTKLGNSWGHKPMNNFKIVDKKIRRLTGDATGDGTRLKEVKLCSALPNT